MLLLITTKLWEAWIFLAVLIPYSIQRPSSKKWYRKLGELFFEMCIYNAFILWKKLNVNNTDHLKFHKILVEELITFHSYGGVANLQTGSRHSNRVGNPLCLVEKHFISVIPSTASKKRAQKPCVRHRKMGMRRDTRYWCKICQVGLCLEECFEVYHTKTDITKSISDVVEESFEESFQEYFEVSYEEEEVEAHMPGSTLQHTDYDSDIDDSIDLHTLLNTV